MRIILFINFAFLSLISYAGEPSPPKNNPAKKINFLPNDAQVIAVVALGKIPQLSLNLSNMFSENMGALIKNTGINILIDLPVTLNVSGANTFTSTRTVTLNPGDSAIIGFNPFLTTTIGINHISVSIPADDDNSNNIAYWRQEVTDNTFSYADTSAVAGPFGFGTGSGLILAMYNMPNVLRVRKVIVHISADPANIGNSVYAVACRGDGVILAQSASNVLTADDLDTDKEFVLQTFPLIMSGGFYVGLAQTAGALAYYPVAYQEAVPVRNAYFTHNLAGGAGGLTASPKNQRFMIQAEINVDLLPVKLQSFTAYRNGNVNKLNWCTSEEVNSKLFEIERSGDGMAFQTIGKVNAAGFSNTNSNYYFIDAKPLQGVNYYRLKMIDIDHEFEFSEIRIVKNAGSSVVTIYPNPATDKLSVKINADVAGKAYYEIYNISGNNMMVKSFAITQGDNSIDIPVDQLAKGTYAFKLTFGNEVIKKTFQKL